MTEQEMKDWIDNATYAQLLYKWRLAPVGDPFFQGEVGDYYSEVMARKKREVGDEAHSRASKNVGWDGCR